MVRLLFLIGCTWFLSLTTLRAGDQLQVSFEPFTMMSQLPSSTVQRVYQDKEGFMWFGTPDGLCRYDGYEVRSLRSDMNNPFLLTSNDIQCITDDDEHHLWVGTKQGLNRLDKRNLHVEHVQDSIFGNDRINSLAADKRGNIWIGTNRGLYRYNLHGQALHHYGYNPLDKKTVSGSSVNQVYADRTGTIWVMCWESGLCRYEPETDTFTRFPRVGKGNNPFRLYQDNQGRYWLGTWGDGFFRFDPNAPRPSMYRQQIPSNTSGLKPETAIFSIVQDDTNGYLWLMSLTGLYVVKPMNDDRPQPIDISSYLKGSSRLYSEIVKDRNNNLWIGAFGEGVIRIGFNRPTVQNHSLDIVRQRMGFYPSIKALSVDKDGLVWLGMNRYGLCLYDRTNNVARVNEEIQGLSELKNIQTVNYIRSIHHTNEHWISCDNRYLYVVAKKGSGVVLKSTIDLNSNNSYNSYGDKVLFEDKEGNVWVGMMGGVIKVTSGKRVVPIAEIPFVTAITQDADGEIWISSEQSGFCRLVRSGNTYKVTAYDKNTEGLTTSNVQSVCHQSGNHIWVGTKEGRVLIFDKRTSRFTDMSKRCAMTGEGILNIKVDSSGTVWISTNKRVTRFNSATGMAAVYSVFDDLAVTSFVAGACSINEAGEVFFGGNRGFCVFLPSNEKRKSATIPQGVQVTDVKVHNQSIMLSGGTDVYDVVEGLLTLRHTDNSIEVDFSSLNYAFPSKVQYAYKLEGVDEEWNYTTATRRFATYNNLDKGKYRLLLRATDENGQWGKTVTGLRVRIKPAVYETWWAYTLYVLAMVMILYGLYRFTTNRLRLKNELKFARLEKDASEELTQTKLRYFTNISHELLTPLTVVSCLIDDLERSFNGQSWQHKAMKINVERLKRLLLQILDFRKLESGNLKLKVTQSDLVAFVRQICHNGFEPLAREKQIHFSLEPAQNSIMGWFDAEKMDTIVYNLLSNAFKYTSKDGSVLVRVEETTGQHRRTARLVVQDTGRGIPGEDLEHIFTRFYSNDPTNTVENHGIGLTLVKEMLELHHGSIRVDSEPGEGSTFTVEIPLDEGDYTDAERVGKDAGQNDVIHRQPINDRFDMDEEERPTAVEAISLLIVEDNTELLHLMERMLSRHYHTHMARDGREALEWLEQHPVDMVVSDIVMPGLDGLELCRRIKGDMSTSHIPVLLLTAKNTSDDRVESYNAGADGYLSKPFELKVLDARIANLLKNRQHRLDQFKSTAELSINTLEMASIDKRFLENAIAVIEAHLSEADFDLDAFSGQLNMSKSSLYRKIKSLTGLSPVEFTKNIRLKHACQLLKNRAGNVSDVAYAVGFSDPKYFTSCFKTAFSITPSDYLKQTKNITPSDHGLSH